MKFIKIVHDCDYENEKLNYMLSYNKDSLFNESDIDDVNMAYIKSIKPIFDLPLNMSPDYRKLPESAMLVDKDKLIFNYKELICFLLKKIYSKLELKLEYEETLILSVSQAKKNYPKNDIYPGIYALHPRKQGKIVKADVFHNSIKLEKDQEMVVLLGKMGAKRITKFEIYNDKDDLKVNINANVSKYADVNFRAEKGNDKGKQVEVVAEYEGNEIDFAPSLLRESTWFSEDKQMITIFNARAFSKNRLKSYSITCDYRDDFNFDFKLAASLLGKAGLNMEADYKNLCSRKYHFKVEF